MPPEDEFDWSLGDTDDVEVVETTPVAERGAQEATPNNLNVQAALDATDDDGDSGEGAADDVVAGETSGDEAGAEVDAEQTGTDAEQDDGHGLILGKFKSVDDLAEAYRNAESRLGQQGNDMGQLRRELDEMRGYMQARDNQPAQLTDDLVSQVDELAMQNPQAAATWALENQPALYNRVMQTWAAADPLSASRFEMALTRAQLEEELTEKFTKQYGSVAETVTEAAQAAQFDNAWKAVAAKHPDMKDLTDQMMEAAAVAPELASALQSGDVASKERLIDNLYWLAKGRQADSIAQVASDLGRKQQKQAAAEKKQAAVASGSSVSARGEKTAIESWKEQMLSTPSTSIFGNLREVS